MTEDGRTAARALGAFLEREQQLPQLVLCSDAVRAVDTAHLIASHAGAHSVMILDDLYDADPDQVIALLQQHGPEGDRHLMIVAHNPTIGALAQQLAARSNRTPAIARSLSHFEPATCAQFAVQSHEWESFDASHAELRRVLTPAMYLNA